MSPRFWRNVALIALAHLALLVALLRWAGASRTDDGGSVTWISSLDVAAANEPDAPTPLPTPEHSTIPALPTPAATAQSDLSAPIPKPSAKSTVSPRKRPTPPEKTPNRKASKIPKKKTAEAKSNESSAKKPIKIAREQRTTRVAASGSRGTERGEGAPAPGAGEAAARDTESRRYASILHTRFYTAWEQPVSVVASGANFSAVARIRIERDGRISDFKVLQPSGNVLVDQSVEAVGKRVTSVESPPTGLLSGGHYDVNVNFALNGE